MRKCPVRTDVEVLGWRQRLDVGGVAGDLRKRDADGDEPVRLGIRERMKNEAVEHPVDQAVAADGQRERQHGDSCESRPANELTHRVAKILDERVHLGPLSWLWQARKVLARVL